MLRRPLIPFVTLLLAAVAGASPAGAQDDLESTPPQQDWMVHMASANGSWNYVPDHIVLVPGGLVQLMVFGDGAFSLTLDDVPGADAEIASTTGVVRTAELRAPATPGEYAFHDKHHPEATGLLIVALPAAQALPTIGVVPGGYESRFSPERLEVAAGAEVRFAANGSFGHNLRAVDGSFDAGDLAPGEATTFRAPETPGTYAFECRFHAETGMRGVLVVAKEASSAEPDESAVDPAGEEGEQRRTSLALGWLLLALAAAALLAGARSPRWPPR